MIYPNKITDLSGIVPGHELSVRQSTLRNGFHSVSVSFSSRHSLRRSRGGHHIEENDDNDVIRIHNLKLVDYCIKQKSQ